MIYKLFKNKYEYVGRKCNWWSFLTVKQKQPL